LNVILLMKARGGQYDTVDTILSLLYDRKAATGKGGEVREDMQVQHLEPRRERDRVERMRSDGCIVGHATIYKGELRKNTDC